MGLFCANVHFRTINDKALAAAVDRRGIAQYRISPAKNGWTSLYEERASEQDDQRIRELAGGLSADLHAAAVAFMVHDSDIACYWLFEDGKLLDEYNSCPDYFDDDADGPGSPSGGRPDVLVRYCSSGVREAELGAILAERPLYAENVIEQLAEALQIDTQRAVADYRDGDSDGGPDDSGAADDDGGGDHGGGTSASVLRGGLAARMGKLTEMLGLSPGGAASADPQAVALVAAAARGDIQEIDRLLAEGVALDVEAPGPLPMQQPLRGLGHVFPGGEPKIAMTPLLAAVANRQYTAAQRLLDAGADPNRGHLLFGTAVLAATSAGEVELLRLVLDRGGDVNAHNARGQTPLALLALGRAAGDRLAQTQAMMKSSGMKVPGLWEKISDVKFPTEGWAACERLLKARGAR